MMLDHQLVMSDAQAITGTAATRIPCSYTIDVTKAGGGDPGLVACITITTSVAATGGAANVTFSIETHTADDFAAERTVLWKSAAIAKATLVAGYSVCKVRLPMNLLRYIAVVALPDTNDTTSGAMDAYLVFDRDHAA